MNPEDNQIPAGTPTSQVVELEQTPSIISVPPSQSHSKRYLILILILSITSIVSTIIYLIASKPKSKTEEALLPNTPNTTAIDSQTHSANITYLMDCSNIRSVVSDKTKQYIGCLGGLVIKDKNTNEIIKELSTLNGLKDNTITDLILYNDNLYIGTLGKPKTNLIHRGLNLPI